MHELAPSPRSFNGDQSQFEDTPSFERIMGVLQTLTCHAEMTGDPAARMGRPLAHGALDMPSYALLCGKPIKAFGLVHTLHVLLATLLCVRVHRIYHRNCSPALSFGGRWRSDLPLDHQHRELARGALATH